MKRLFNLSAYNLDWFNNDWQQVEKFCKKNGLVGVELLAKGVNENICIEKIPIKLIKGMHLSYYLNWLPLKTGEKQELNLSEIIDNYRQELRLASKLEVDYVIFHASHTSMEEIFTGNFKYTNKEILIEVANIINEVLVDLDLNFKLLFENLWWNGLTFLNKTSALNFLDKINYENKGFLLDTGHLMNTNLKLRDEADGLEYIKRILADFQQDSDLFYGVHLHKSLSGIYRQNNTDKLYEEFKDSNDLDKKSRLTHQLIFNTDQHLPFSNKVLNEMLQIIEPIYITHEFTCATKEEFNNYLKIQERALQGE
ncbi:TIM barrel protein [Selenihalanaerobacter shriftii]|uniref:Sugar phosphate isomerase/epimerase n=1 Tax=Selenihalanaerobacter shriftii TaxID=142842 RepID=A0A1T4K0A9_9FIRM|nr:TIM barrel protein [Selenihalanaerobacter shriftii]SJZ35860.1 Sugar phosphate isomerase/epimerase [Selenihalanaerobacter shriftii]